MPIQPSKFAYTAYAALVVLAVFPALTEAQNASTQPADPTAPRVSLPPVTVVAQKEPANAQDLPVSVSTVFQDLLRGAGIVAVSDAAIFAPNTFYNEFTARKLSNPIFRGIGSSPANPGVATYIDGVPQLNTNSSSIEFLDITQVEFVRGPQSALFGRNALGGVVNITSARPSLTKWTGTLAAPFGNFSSRDIRGQVSGPVGEDVAVGLAFSPPSRS
jgi:iron complex outermembrane receptor protein